MMKGKGNAVGWAHYPAHSKKVSTIISLVLSSKPGGDRRLELK